jgi:hypothetical protein
MRYLMKFNESEDNDQNLSDLRESLLEVSDRLGDPTIKTFEMGTETGYVVQYNIPIATIGELTTDAFYEAIDALYSTKEDILQTADRFSDRFQTTISQMAGKLKIRLTPITIKEGDYNFLKNCEGRTIEVSESEIRRWAVSKSQTITSIDNDDQDAYDTSSLYITFSGSNGLPELVDLIEAEKEVWREKRGGNLDREFDVYLNDNMLCLTPDEEKTYIYTV